MHEALFAPLGMTRTALIYTTRFADNVADRIDLNGRFRAQSNADTIHKASISPSISPRGQRAGRR